MLSMAVHRGQQVDLPESGTAGLETAEAVSVTIQNQNGILKLFVDEKPVELPSLSRCLQERRKKIWRRALMSRSLPINRFPIRSFFKS